MLVCPKCGLEHPDDRLYCSQDGVRLTQLDRKRTERKQSAPGTILGSYRLIRLLGEGGMGFVFLAEHTSLGRYVAIKTLRKEYADNPDVIRRFFGEARAVNQIRHQNIVEITDFVEDLEGESYFVMEYLQGRSLGQLLGIQAPLSVQRAIHIGKQVADCLEAVHQASIIHRDLKAENIFLVNHEGQTDFVKLLDFGLAKLIKARQKSILQTADGVILGTPEYMSPEQASGKAVDHRTDIYSLGIILYEMVVGKRPFSGKTFSEIAIKHLTKTPVKPNRKLKDSHLRIPKKLERLIMDCLKKKPQDRPQSMAEVASRLQKISAFDSGYSTIEPSYGNLGRWRVRMLLGSLCAIGVVVSLFLLLSSVRWQNKGVGVAAAQATIRLVLNSIPYGADVFQNGGHIGKTPLKLVYDKNPNKKLFEFRLKDYRTVHQAVSLEKNTQLVVTMHPKHQVTDLMDLPSRDPPVDEMDFPSQRPKRVKTNVPSNDPEATLNPFD